MLPRFILNDRNRGKKGFKFLILCLILKGQGRTFGDAGRICDTFTAEKVDQLYSNKVCFTSK
jgi:hypothetical protein